MKVVLIDRSIRVVVDRPLPQSNEDGLCTQRYQAGRTAQPRSRGKEVIGVSVCHRSHFMTATHEETTRKDRSNVSLLLLE